MIDLFKIPFSVDYLSNNQWIPDKEKPTYMTQEEYDGWVNEYNIADAKVMFKNTQVLFESCDCGGDYGCSHPPYPYQIVFKDASDVESFFEDDGFYLQSPKGFVKFDNEKDVTMGHFTTACELIGINLIRVENYGENN